ncbi:hypothetical protein TSAR_011109 [Trichomalopsis sarcophagae]|uniref:Uncharacterized protein n=1 Tax=Trichomalopsis sarcophagae TaxID=543379 RepID=A0A232EGC8_9HYME|nr:hypothetical protein TSAR_011109 [Trichomalopsis sarcophagae]
MYTGWTILIYYGKYLRFMVGHRKMF